MLAMQDKKRAVLVWARRHGKDYTCWYYLIYKALTQKGIYYFVFPEYSQARKAFWDAITEDGQSYLDFIPAKKVQRKLNHEMKLHLTNGSIIQVLGSDNYDAIRGTNPCGVILSEYAYQNPNVWKLILDPILSKNKGWAVFNSTPNGRNHFFDLYQYGINNPDEFYVSKITNSDTHFISDNDIAKKKAQGISEEFLAQEYECSFDIGVEGSYYGKQMRDMKNEKRIGYVPYDRNCLVYTAWDLGFADSMSIVFFQRRGNEILVIDFYENRGYQLAHYLEELRRKNYNYGKHYIPHDGKAHDRLGNTFTDIAQAQGFSMTVLPRQTSILEGIEKVRGMLPRVFIDETKCDYLIRCLLDYHAEYDERSQVYKSHPHHNWSSHAADAVRLMIQSMEYLGTGSMSKEELDNLKNKAKMLY